ncbi:MLP-like protein 43 [Papaver somniferum]|uniref:MLP-like protein 43 n=1 Tax=Papaver somniferum TaxID=3469 RepID=UPI000E7029DA|nr:MLP-like protein 43 [Papaver somniferum]
MAQLQKLELVHEVKCCPDKLYRMFTRDAPQLSKYLPKVVQSVQVIGVGEIRLCTGFVWKFVAGGGSTISTKEKITAVDNKNRSITFTVLEGDVMEDFKNFSFKLDITSQDWYC